MKEGQKAIYYIAGGDEERLRKSPLLEMYRKRGHRGPRLRRGDRRDRPLGPGPLRGPRAQEREPGRQRVRARRRGGQGREARGREPKPRPPSRRPRRPSATRSRTSGCPSAWSESPACVVVDSDDPSLQLRELMKQLGGSEMPEVKPILELNGEHPLVKRLAARRRPRPRTSRRSSSARPSSSRGPSSPTQPTSPRDSPDC